MEIIGNIPIAENGDAQSENWGTNIENIQRLTANLLHGDNTGQEFGTSATKFQTNPNTGNIAVYEKDGNDWIMNLDIGQDITNRDGEVYASQPWVENGSTFVDPTTPTNFAGTGLAFNKTSTANVGVSSDGRDYDNSTTSLLDFYMNIDADFDADSVQLTIDTSEDDGRGRITIHDVGYRLTFYSDVGKTNVLWDSETDDTWAGTPRSIATTLDNYIIALENPAQTIPSFTSGSTVYITMQFKQDVIVRGSTRTTFIPLFNISGTHTSVINYDIPLDEAVTITGNHSVANNEHIFIGALTNRIFVTVRDGVTRFTINDVGKALSTRNNASISIGEFTLNLTVAGDYIECKLVDGVWQVNNFRNNEKYSLVADVDTGTSPVVAMESWVETELEQYATSAWVDSRQIANEYTEDELETLTPVVNDVAFVGSLGENLTDDIHVFGTTLIRKFEAYVESNTASDEHAKYSTIACISLGSSGVYRLGGVWVVRASQIGSPTTNIQVVFPTLTALNGNITIEAVGSNLTASIGGVSETQPIPSGYDFILYGVSHNTVTSRPIVLNNLIITPVTGDVLRFGMEYHKGLQQYIGNQWSQFVTTNEYTEDELETLTPVVNDVAFTSSYNYPYNIDRDAPIIQTFGDSVRIKRLVVDDVYVHDSNSNVLSDSLNLTASVWYSSNYWYVSHNRSDAFGFATVTAKSGRLELVFTDTSTTLTVGDQSQTIDQPLTVFADTVGRSGVLVSTPTMTNVVITDWDGNLISPNTHNGLSIYRTSWDDVATKNWTNNVLPSAPSGTKFIGNNFPVVCNKIAHGSYDWRNITRVYPGTATDQQNIAFTTATSDMRWVFDLLTVRDIPSIDYINFCYGNDGSTNRGIKDVKIYSSTIKPSTQYNDTQGLTLAYDGVFSEASSHTDRQDVVFNTAHTARYIVLDAATNWYSSSYMGIRNFRIHQTADGDRFGKFFTNDKNILPDGDETRDIGDYTHRVRDTHTRRILLPSEGAGVSGDVSFRSDTGATTANMIYYGTGTNAKDIVVSNNGGHNLTGVMLTWGATAWVASSDRRAKKDIIPMDNCLDNILKLRPVQFGWKDDLGVTDYGLIAQEVVDHFPHCVHAPNDGLGDECMTSSEGSEDLPEMWGVQYSELVAPLIGAVQELSAEVESLKNDISIMSDGKYPTIKSKAKKNRFVKAFIDGFRFF